MTRIFFKKIGPSLLFLAAGTTDTKFRRSTGVTTANSTNKYQNYKSVELGDQLAVCGTLLQSVTVCSSVWQSLSDSGSQSVTSCGILW